MKTEWSVFEKVIAWPLFGLALVVGFCFLVYVVVNINYVDFGLPQPDQPGFQTYTIAYLAVRLGVAACFFLLALAIRPRK